MIKERIKNTLDKFAKEYGLEDICYYERLYTLLLITFSDINEQDLIIILNTDIEHFDDLEIVQLSEKELVLLMKVEVCNHLLTIDYIGNKLRIKSIEKIEDDIIYETLKISDFNKLIK